MENVASATRQPYRLLFVANEGDDAEIAELIAAKADHIIVPANRISWACKINDGFRATTEEWIFTGADDLNFHPDWFERALLWANDTIGIIGTNDICNPRVMTGEHSTHMLVRRSYIEKWGTIDEPGVVLHERYRHAFADDECVATAKARGVYVHAYDSIVEHMHPNTQKSEMDETYKEGMKYSADGRRVFSQRKKLWADETRIRARMQPPPSHVVVVTATYGGYDPHLRVPAVQDIPTDWVCVTDDPGLVVPNPWHVIVREGRFDDPRMSAKVPKMLPDVGCDDVVWMDASHEITSPSFVREALLSRHDGIAAFRHPRRDCAYREIDALLGSENQNGLYFNRPLRAQKAAYKAERYPLRHGLYACGVLAWDLRDPRARQLGQAWLDETEKWSHQDQIEFPVVCRRLGIKPGTFPIRQIDNKFGKPGDYLGNRWLRIHRHIKLTVPA
jgi:hypothetical protein